jgi:hypothetical protein
LKLAPLHPVSDAMRLDIVFVERPTGDRLLGPELWDEVDQVAALDAATRDTLDQNGFRLGVVGARPPVALQTLLGLKSDFLSEPQAEKAKQLVGRQSFLRSGGETEIQVSPFYDDCTVRVQDAKQTHAREFANARCIYRVTAERLQDGWVRLDFVPQIQFGDFQIRHAATESGWQFVNSQKTESFFPQRFSINLSLGEMVVLSAADDCPGTMGHLFFVGADEHAPVQRMLVVRLSDMANSDDLFKK